MLDRQAVVGSEASTGDLTGSVPDRGYRPLSVFAHDQPSQAIGGEYLEPGGSSVSVDVPPPFIDGPGAGPGGDAVGDSIDAEV